MPKRPVRAGSKSLLISFKNWSIWSRFGIRQARGRFGPFSDRPERGPRDDRNGGPGREFRETIRVSKSMMMNTMTSMMRTMTMMMPTSSRSRQKIRGVQRSNSEFLNRPLDTKNFITRRHRKTSRHHRSQRSQLENRIPKPTSGHQELVRNSRSRSARTKSR